MTSYCILPCFLFKMHNAYYDNIFMNYFLCKCASMCLNLKFMHTPHSDDAWPSGGQVQDTWVLSTRRTCKQSLWYNNCSRSIRENCRIKVLLQVCSSGQTVTCNFQYKISVGFFYFVIFLLNVPVVLVNLHTRKIKI